MNRERLRRFLRRAGIVAALLFGLAIFALAALLLPAHRQIRSIEPKLPSATELVELLGVQDGPTSVRRFKVAEQTFDGGRFGHNVIALDWADGRRFLIDLAMDEPGATEFSTTLERLMGADPGVFHRDVAGHLGETLEGVAGVGFTHLHIDHVQGIEVFCATRGPGAVAVQSLHQSSEHNFNTKEAAALLESSCLERRVLDGDGVLPVPGFPGLAAVPLGGHTPGSTLFAAAVEGHLWLFSGDITNSKADLLEDRGKGVLYSGLIVPEHTGRTALLRAWLRDLDARPDMTVVVSHDVESAKAEGFPAP